MAEVIGIDHIYLAVTNLEQSEAFYDDLMSILGFRKKHFELHGEPHIQYFNRQFGVVLRPARTLQAHNPYAPGLHHLCFRVESEAELVEIGRSLEQQGIEVDNPVPQHYPEYAPDYVALFVVDPDGVRIEVTNYRQERRQRHDHWDDQT